MPARRTAVPIGRRGPFPHPPFASSVLPGYTVVGLPDAAGRESRERVRAALLSSGLEYPQQRVTVNLAPASVRKTGAGLELGIALALTCAAGGLPSGVLDRIAVLGELGLDGGVRPVVGTLALVDALARTAIEHVVVPAGNASEAASCRASPYASRVRPASSTCACKPKRRGPRRPL